MNYTTYNFDNFNYVDYIIKIPERSVFYRGIRDRQGNENILRKNIPIYLASKESARRYSDNNNDNIFTIALKKDLKVLDIRKIQSILQLIIDSCPNYNDIEFRYNMGLFSIVLGLVDYNTQIKEFKNIARVEKISEIPFIIEGINRMISFESVKIDTFKIPRGPFTKLGVRIGLTDIDARMVIFLREMLSDICDGYIAPKMLSPFQPDFHINEELVLFDTNDLEIIDKKIPILNENIITLLDNFNKLHNFMYKTINFKAYVHSKQNGGNYLIEDKNDFFLNTKKVKAAEKISKRLIKKIIIKKKEADFSYYDECVKNQSFSPAFEIKKNTI